MVVPCPLNPLEHKNTMAKTEDTQATENTPTNHPVEVVSALDNGAAHPLVPPPDENGFIGELSEQAKLAIGTVQRQQSEIVTQLGSVEIHKAQLIGNHNGLQEQAKRILDSEAVRLGIPKGKPWQVSPDGMVKLVR